MLYFISGLPRSGSTLLCNILLQNPKFHVTATSGLLDVLYNVRNQWNNLIEFQTASKQWSDATQLRVLQSIISGYFGDVTKPIIFDKSRGWLAYIELAQYLLNQPIKVLVPVRDIRDILSSFELLWRKASQKSQIKGEIENYFQFQTLEGRLDYWMQANQPVGLAYNRLRDAIQRGHSDKLLIIPFEALTTKPQNTLQTVYKFINESYYKHDFNKIEQKTYENDRLHGFDDLHTIRSKIKPIKPRWPDVLGNSVNKYKNLNFWQ